MNKPSVVIFDVDGTLCDVRPLRHLVVGPGRDFDAFHRAAADAHPNWDVVDHLNGWRDEDNALAFMLTARDGKWADLTLDWLGRHGIPFDGFCHRPAGDTRPDHVVKAEMLDWISRHHDVIHAYDDRPRVIRMWWEHGIPVTVVGGWYGEPPDPFGAPVLSTYLPGYDRCLPDRYYGEE